MKDDELLKVLDNAKIDERREIIEYILQKLGDKLYDRTHLFHIITKTGEIYELGMYEDLLKHNSNVSPAYIFVANLWSTSDYDLVLRYCPFIGERDLLIYAYLLKHYYYITHFVDLKYVAIIIHFSTTIKIEVVDIDTVANNMNLTKLIRMLSEVEDENKKVEEFELYVGTQRLFNGHNFYEAVGIIESYYRAITIRYIPDMVSLGKEVGDIRDAYERIFQPYRVEYDLETKQLYRVVYDSKIKQLVVSGNNESR